MGNKGTPSLRELLKELRREGWEITYRRKHIRAFGPDGQKILTISRSSSDRRAFRNLRKDMRKK